MILRYPFSTSFRSLFSLSALLLAATVPSSSQSTLKQRDKTVQLTPAPATDPDRSAAYYHDGLAHLYEELAVNNGRPDYATQAVEEYKLALTADPNSKYLQDGLADLYFKIGRIREAVTSAQDRVRKNPNDIGAHQLLGKVYLRSLGDMQGPQASEMLQLAIGEYEKLAQLQPKDLETHLLLGQLYGLNHDTAKAEASSSSPRRSTATPKKQSSAWLAFTASRASRSRRSTPSPPSPPTTGAPASTSRSAPATTS